MADGVVTISVAQMFLICSPASIGDIHKKPGVPKRRDKAVSFY
jgi:hypothetical protein